MSISEKQLNANRENAKKSTGPTSEEGKDICRRNARRHYLTGQVSTMTEEDRAAYNGRLHALIDDMKPQGALELTLVQSVAHGFWRLSRAEAIEENTFALEAERNENRIECINPQITEALLQAMTFFNNPHTFSLLTLYEQRIHRKTHKDLRTLLDLQASREKTRGIISQPEKAMTAAAGSPAEVSAAAAAQTESATYTAPAVENGFVFSNASQQPITLVPAAKNDPDPLDSAPEVPSAA